MGSRPRLSTTIAWDGVLAIALFLAVGCMSEHSAPATRVGRLQLELETTSSSGFMYRLRQGTFDITLPPAEGGTAVSRLTRESGDQSATSLGVDLRAREYVINLLPGWHLERAATDGNFASVTARLVSDNPLAFAIQSNHTTSVQFRFSVGDDTVDFGFGRLEVDIAVDDERMDGGSDDGGTDIDECALGTDTCTGYENCINTPGSFRCECKPGFVSDGVACNDLNECTNTTICGGGTCINSPGSYSCLCNPGYQWNGNTCVDIDECTTGVCGTDGTTTTCHNIAGGYFCDCAVGYKPVWIANRWVGCDDVNECEAPAACGPNSRCTNTEGSFTCACLPGFAGDGNNCNDIDECAAGIANCGANATCTNTPGRYTCACNPGFTGDGLECTQSF